MVSRRYRTRPDGEEFLHLSTVLNNFVEDLAKLNNLTAQRMREQRHPNME